MSENSAASPMLTDEEIIALEIEVGGTFTQGPVPFARAIESALLSKLRAPVAEVQIGVSVTEQGATVCLMQPHANGSATVIYSNTHPPGDSLGRAALASAPVAKPKRAPIDDGICWSSKEIQRRQKEEDDARAAYYHSRASAPVAGEAQPVTWEDVRDALAILLSGATGKASKHWIAPLEDATASGPLAKMRACLAAPQASAAQIREALQKSFDLGKFYGGLPETDAEVAPPTGEAVACEHVFHAVPTKPGFNSPCRAVCVKCGHAPTPQFTNDGETS